jgi:hypothetical protein
MNFYSGRFNSETAVAVAVSPGSRSGFKNMLGLLKSSIYTIVFQGGGDGYGRGYRNCTACVK